MSSPPHSPDIQTAFSAGHARDYAKRTARQVPGFADLHRITAQLLAERVPDDGRILVVGAGGGLEIKALADLHARWTFDGVDPSANMLATAETIIAPHTDRVTLHHGYVDDAPVGPYNGATCILTMHFVPRDQRLTTLQQIRRRLTPGAPFIVAHISFPQTEPERSQWIERHAIFGGTTPENLDAAKQALSTKLTILSPEDEEAMLHQAGFSNASLIYAGLSFRGWVAYA